MEITSNTKIPPGAVQIHLYDSKNVLMPRGSRQKESIHNYLLEKLQISYESWTDPKYVDNPDKKKLIQSLYNNLINEAMNAWEDFLKGAKI
jgi:hypothetical protein